MKLNPFNGPKTSDELHELASRPTESVVAALEEIDSDIVVIGAGGKMGFHLSRMLQRALTRLKSDFRVLAVSRFASPGATDLFTQHDIATISTDLTHSDSLERLPDSQNVFFLAGVKFGTSGNPGLLRQMNVELPRRVAERFRNGRIVALSTGCVYSFVTPQSGGSREEDATDSPGDYAASCMGREQAFVQSGVAASLVRLNYSVDLRYGVLVDIANRVLHELPVDVATGHVNVIWQGDANARIIQSLSEAATPPFVINVTGQRILAVRDVAKRFGEIFEKEVSITGMEAETAWLNNSSQSRERWGNPAVDEDCLIRWVANWLKHGGETLDRPTQFQVRDGNYQ